MVKLDWDVLLQFPASVDLGCLDYYLFRPLQNSHNCEDFWNSLEVCKYKSTYANSLPRKMPRLGENQEASSNMAKGSGIK